MAVIIFFWIIHYIYMIINFLYNYFQLKILRKIRKLIFFCICQHSNFVEKKWKNRNPSVPGFPLLDSRNSYSVCGFMVISLIPRPLIILLKGYNNTTYAHLCSIYDNNKLNSFLTLFTSEGEFANIYYFRWNSAKIVLAYKKFEKVQYRFLP